MTPFRRRMLEDTQLWGFSTRTQECYLAACPARPALLSDPRASQGDHRPA